MLIKFVENSNKNIYMKCEKKNKQNVTDKRVHFSIPPHTYADAVKQNCIGNPQNCKL